MKIFIAGARKVNTLNDTIKEKLDSICQNKHSVLIGDCYGVDAAVQNFFAQRLYRDVTVYASNGVARNNIGDWNVENIRVDSAVRGFDFYKQKDIAMAESADYGFMIWDGSSKGTLNNIINLANNGKKVLVYLSVYDKMFIVNDINTLEHLVKICPKSTMKTYRMLAPQKSEEHGLQLSLFG